jgi:hypothetical protein
VIGFAQPVEAHTLIVYENYWVGFVSGVDGWVSDA